MPDVSLSRPRPSYSIERYIRFIARYYISAAIIMTLLIGATYLTVKVALDRHALQQDISMLTSRQFIQFQQLANQTRAVMRASADPNMVERIIEPMLKDVRGKVASIRSTMAQLANRRHQLNSNLFEIVTNHDDTGGRLYAELNERLEAFLTRAETVINASHEERRRRYTFWGPIDFAVSAESPLMRQFDDLIDHTHRRSQASIGFAMVVTNTLLFMLATVLILASLFLFYPILTRLRREHRRKADAEKKLTRMAHTDALTHLKNRSYFNAALQDLFHAYHQEGRGFSILLVDLDHFKSINDGFGHLAGDATLCHIAKVILNESRVDDIVARLGGDEFAMLLPGVTGEKTLTAIAERLVKAIHNGFPFEDHTLRVSASIGGATVPTHATESTGLVRVADLALYVAKTGRNKAVIFDKASMIRRLEENELMSALTGAAKRDEFVVHYQPKVSMNTGVQLGLEALVRWKHPTQGLLGPGAFLPLMESPQLISDMTRAVARIVCRDIRQWKTDGLVPGPVAINFPEVLLINENGFDLLNTAIMDHGVTWRDISVEVTEDVFLDRYSEFMHASMTRFRLHGTSVSLDDFGTGFASLLHLRDFPFDELKIDRGFVANIGVDNKSEQIIRAMVDLSRNLGKRCVAEGIETEAQRDFLIRIGCEIGQGFYFAKPMPAADITRRLSRQDDLGEPANPPGTCPLNSDPQHGSTTTTGRT